MDTARMWSTDVCRHNTHTFKIKINKSVKKIYFQNTAAQSNLALIGSIRTQKERQDGKDIETQQDKHQTIEFQVQHLNLWVASKPLTDLASLPAQFCCLQPTKFSHWPVPFSVCSFSWKRLHVPHRWNSAFTFSFPPVMACQGLLSRNACLCPISWPLWLSRGLMHASVNCYPWNP